MEEPTHIREIFEPIINSKKIKYEVLDKLFFSNLLFDVEEVSLFFSVESILKQFYNPNIIEIVNSCENEYKFFLSSELLNLAAHYRHYFWSRFEITSNIFFFYASKINSRAKKLNFHYRDKYYEKRFNNLEYNNLNNNILTNLNLANMLSDYLPHIYVVDTGDIEPSIFMESIIANNKAPDLMNFIFSNNLIDMQEVIYDKTNIITLKSDNSKLIDKDNIYHYLLRSSKSKNNTSISMNLFTTIFSIVGYPPHNLEGIKNCGIVKTIQRMEKYIEEGLVIDKKSLNPEAVFELFANSKRLKNQCIKNFQIIDYQYGYEMLNKFQLEKFRNQLNDKSDNQELMNINNKYFQAYPLNLIELFEGEN